MTKSEWIYVRDEYIEQIRKELLGPGSEMSIPDAEHEVISSKPQQRYSVGILFPQGNKMNADNDDSDRPSDEKEEEPEEGDMIEDSASADAAAIKSIVNDGIESDEEIDEADIDETVSLASQNLPASMGLTFFARGNCEIINGALTFGTYRPIKVSDCCFPYSEEGKKEIMIPPAFSSYLAYDKENSCLRLKGNITRKEIKALGEKDSFTDYERKYIGILYTLSDQLRGGFVREPHSLVFSLNFAEGDYYEGEEITRGVATLRLTAVRRQVQAELYSVTVMLVNTTVDTPTGQNCVFQPVIKIATENNKFAFCDYTQTINHATGDDEEQSLELQYRNKRTYGTGLGVSLDWNIDDSGCGTIRTDFFPQYEVPPVDFELAAEYAVDKQVFKMKYLSDLEETNKGKKIAGLSSLVEAYGKWIQSLNDRIPRLDEKFHKIAHKNVAGCSEAYKRMRNGLEILNTDDTAWESFELANRAMFMQRVHIKLQEKYAAEKGPIYPDDDEIGNVLKSLDYRTADQLVDDYFAWRPFQLAFLLLSVDSIVNDNGEDRNIVDLIWFPTGGGKTEAYLGLTAFTIFYRRLKHLPESDGTAVIMRYTLRLLAAQQFTRASTLICACEYIRKDSALKRPKRPKYKPYPLGDKEITIGLWIGGEHTPNKNKGTEGAAKACIDKLQKADRYSLRDAKDRYNKFQVLKCPWCGTRLTKDLVGSELKGSWGYEMKNGSRFYMKCPHSACTFKVNLPIQVVDEELYKEPPTLLFGTVDKFAMLTWNDSVGNFFAVGSENRAPELIIQDELHLISGPLGTMVGLYETAIDALCRKDGFPCKIIASTATIRRAAQQCSALYDRDVLQFPHPGLDAEDSFFAREATLDDNHYGRRYVGVLPTGKTKVMMENRSLAALLQTAQVMDVPDKVKDKFWTVTAYFNSLKDLGRCSSLLDDDVKDFVIRIARRTNDTARVLARTDELTSRVSTTTLNETLDKLERREYRFDPKTGRHNVDYASNTVLATNMISVGIDVARLNVMLMVGQPKLTSEYIQASSRVGRSYPGVAFVMYDSTKSRDRSHYEQFLPYHAAFYKHVEPTGATPFSGPARDRALHGVVIALMRYLNPDLREDDDAGKFTCKGYASSCETIKKILLNRNSSIMKRLSMDMDDESSTIEAEIDEIFERWEALASQYSSSNFYYGSKFQIAKPEDGEGRLLKAYGTAPEDNAIETMTSMRNVDITAGGSVLIWEEIK